MRIIITFVLMSITAFSFGQQRDSIQKKGTKKIKIIPYVSYNRTYDFMFGAVPMIMYKIDKNDSISPPSISGAMGVYTTNKTWFTLAFSKLYFKEDQWRMTIAAGLGNVNSQFLQSGTTSEFINYQTGANFFKIEVQRKIGHGLYIGGNYLYTKFDNEYAFETPVEEEVKLNGLGLVFLWDKRDDVYYPKNGSKFNFNFTSYPEFMSNEDASSQIAVQYNQYINTNKTRDVFALRAYGGFGLGEVPFNNLIVVGGTDLRGYSMGEYRGKQLIAFQSEYRYNFKHNMGLVGFAGIGTIFESNIESNNGELLPSAGFGFRYTAFPEYKMNVGLDIAAGKGDWGVYFRIGESF